MQNLFKLPIINIKPLIAHGADLSKKSVGECVESMHIACRDIGFIALKGHNISRELRRETLKLSREFFALQTAEKQEIDISKFNDCIGYQYFGQNVTQNERDSHEGIDYYKYTNNPIHEPFNIDKIPWPQNPSSFESVFTEYIDECLKFGQLIMSGIALSLRLPSNWFDDQCNDSFYVLRILHYPLMDDMEGFGEFGCGEHTDYGCLTLINSDNTTNCLEIKDSNGIYRKVNINTLDEDCFIVNIGDMLNLWSDGLYQSTPHRVLPPKQTNICKESMEFNKRNNSNIGRISIPFFYEPNWNTVIKPIQFNMEQSHSLPWTEQDKLKWKQMEEFRNNSKPIMYGDHLKSKVLANFY